MGTMENEPYRAHEIGVLVDTAAPTQDLAHEFCNFLVLEMQHIGFPGQMNNAANIAVSPFAARHGSGAAL